MDTTPICLLILPCLLYLLFGLGIYSAVFCIDKPENPIWALPIVTLWPAFLVICALAVFISWIIDCIDYYRNKEK